MHFLLYYWEVNALYTSFFQSDKETAQIDFSHLQLRALLVSQWLGYIHYWNIKFKSNVTAVSPLLLQRLFQFKQSCSALDNLPHYKAGWGWHQLVMWSWKGMKSRNEKNAKGSCDFEFCPVKADLIIKPEFHKHTHTHICAKKHRNVCKRMLLLFNL